MVGELASGWLAPAGGRAIVSIIGWALGAKRTGSERRARVCGERERASASAHVPLLALLPGPNERQTRVLNTRESLS